MPGSAKSTTIASNKKNSRRNGRNRPQSRRNMQESRRIRNAAEESAPASAQSELDICAICMGEIEAENIAAGNLLRLHCGHIFHKECIAQLVARTLMGNIVCPSCRTPLLPTEVDLIREYIKINPTKYTQSNETARLNAAAAANHLETHFPSHFGQGPLGPRRQNDRYARNLAAHSYLLDEGEAMSAEELAEQRHREEIYAGYAIQARELRRQREDARRLAGARYREQIRSERRRNATSNANWKAAGCNTPGCVMSGGKRITRKIYKCKKHGCKDHNHK